MAGLKPGGVGEYFEGEVGDPGRKLILSVYTSTCAHCGHHTEFPSMRTMMDYVDVCFGCMKLICLGCVGKPCNPMEKEAERQEMEERLKQKLEQQNWRCY